MKILNVNMSIDPVTGGGTAERTVRISRALAAAGVHCHILTTAAPSHLSMKNSAVGVPITALPCLAVRHHIPVPAMAVVADLVREADVVHLMNHWTLINAMVYGIARRLKTPYVVCPAGALPVFGRSRLPKHLYNMLIGRRILAHASACIAISPNEIEQFAAYGINEESITVIPNGVDPAAFEQSDVEGFRKKYGLDTHPFVLFMGRLNRIKGPDLLLEAFHRLGDRYRQYHLVFAGPDGGMQAQLQEMASAPALSGRVHFTGYLGGKDKNSAYRAATLLAIPSRQEAMSIVVLEAGISGTAVLLTVKCGFNAVGAVGGGRVVSATVEGIRGGLEMMLGDEGQTAVMGESLRQFVLANFTWNEIIKNYLALFIAVTGKR